MDYRFSMKITAEYLLRKVNFINKLIIIFIINLINHQIMVTLIIYLFPTIALAYKLRIDLYVKYLLHSLGSLSCDIYSIGHFKSTFVHV